MRGRAGVQDPTPDGALRLDQLMKQPGFAYPWLAHHSDDFAVTAPRGVERGAKLLQLGFASDETTKSSEGGDLEPRPRSTRPLQLEHLDRRVQTVDRHGAERLGLHKRLD